MATHRQNYKPPRPPWRWWGRLLDVSLALTLAGLLVWFAQLYFTMGH